MKVCHINRPPYHYIIVRQDLPPGFQSAQIVHAAGLSAKDITPDTNAVVLTVPDEDSLVALSKVLLIPHVLVREVDEPYTGQATAIGIPPTRDRIKSLQYLSLLGSEQLILVSCVCGSKPDQAPFPSSSVRLEHIE